MISWRSLYLLLSLTLVEMPVVTQAASFNCNIAERPDEVLICQNDRLSALDERMSSLYFRLRNRLIGSERRQLEADQAAWLQDRFACGRDFPCIFNLYQGRISELANY
jgi:uncharacterized protein